MYAMLRGVFRPRESIVLPVIVTLSNIRPSSFKPQDLVLMSPSVDGRDT